MNKIFDFKESRYRLRNNNCLISTNVKTVRSGILSPLKSETVSLPTNLKKKYVHGQQKTALIVFAKYTFKMLTLNNLI